MAIGSGRRLWSFPMNAAKRRRAERYFDGQPLFVPATAAWTPAPAAEQEHHPHQEPINHDGPPPYNDSPEDLWNAIGVPDRNTAGGPPPFNDSPEDLWNAIGLLCRGADTDDGPPPFNDSPEDLRNAIGGALHHCRPSGRWLFDETLLAANSRLAARAHEKPGSPWQFDAVLAESCEQRP